MSAIYQRARPIHWDEVVGQEHVKDVLRAALERGRVGHAYLFSGPRGVGKTTTARLIAMTANCEVEGRKPCGECPSCLAVRSGSHPDVLEIDAASNNSVDDVRELREKVALSPMRGGKKIYILDEAHMMSRAAFNALLKTLEEPPPHVIFVLATTEPEKILPTILSRCQHYRFRRLSDEEIAGKLSGLCAREGVEAEHDALALIGRLADGAMRDGESLLERMLAAGGAITRAGVEAALGLPPSERVADMARALVLGEAEDLLRGAGHLYREGYAARSVVEGLKGALREALHASLGLGSGVPLEGAEVPRLLRLQAALDEQESRFSRGADLMALELALTHALLSTEAPGAGAAAGGQPGADVTARLAKLEREIAQLRGARGSAPASAAPTVAPAVPDFDPMARGARAAPVTPAPAATAPAARTAPSEPQGSWQDVLRQADIKMRALLKVARINPVDGALVIVYDDKHKFHAKQVLEKFDELAALVQRVFGAVDVELTTPEGSKKKSGRGAGDGSVTAPVVTLRSAAREAVARVAPTAAPAASTRDVVDEVPDFSPTRSRPAPRAVVPEPSAPAAAPAAPSPVSAAPPAAPPAPWEEAAVSAQVYDPEPVLQEPVWDDAPPAAGAAPRVAAPVETSWDDLGTGRGTEAAATPKPAPAPARVATGAAGALREHPVFQEATRLFSGRVRDAGVVRRAKGGPGPVEDGEDVEPSEAEVSA